MQHKIKSKYFNFKEYLNVLNVDYLKAVMILIFTAVRNMGKSYGIWEFIRTDIWERFNYKYKVAYIRTNIEKMKKAKNAFNANYKGKYKIIGEVIYKIEVDEKGKELLDKAIEIGRFVDVMNEDNYRSGAGEGNFENYIFAFWDEFNEDTQINANLYEKFIMLFSTLKRQNYPFIMCLVGNKINANNDIFINLELDTSNHNLNDDYIQEIINPNNDKLIGYYVDIGFDTFKHLNNNDDIVRGLAGYNKNTDKLFNEGGFLKGQSYNVLIYRTYILPTKKIKNYFTFKDMFIEYGTFGPNDALIYFHKIDKEEMDKQYKIYALDMLGLMNSKDARKHFDTDRYVNMCNMWSKKIKNNLLYFTSFELKIEIEKYVIMYSNIWK